MRPLAGSEAFQPRSRKPSVAEPHPVPDARSTSPVTYFLRRASQGNEASSSVDALPGHIVSPVQSLADTLDSLPQSTSTIVPQKDREEAGHSPRRRSTLKARETTDPPGTLSTQSQNQTLPQEPLTPLLIPSNTSSLPSSPKSTSIKSLRPSEASSVAEDAGSQAIFSSGDEEPGPEPPLQLEEAAPQLIMPSIRMPSRRPFTERGKQIGNFKVLIAGSKGVGKTSLIKSIVQICEDIVHVDPLPTGKPSMVRSYSKGKHRSAGPEQPQIAEINASTRPYPSWWSEIEDSKVLRRRKSLGDTILDRNLCFVDTASHENPNIISEYMAMQIQKAIKAPTTAKHDFAALLSGSGGSQVDLIFYMLSGDTLDADILHIQTLSKLGNVIPLLSKADLLSADDITALKSEIRAKVEIAVLPKLPAFDASDSQEPTEDASAPYTVSSATGPDHETMDASLLMSPDYVQPLVPSELAILVRHIFETNIISYLRYSAAKKLTFWHAEQCWSTRVPNPAIPSLIFSPRPSSLASPLPDSLSNSGVLVPLSSDLSLNATSNSQAMIRLAEHAQQEERLAQIRLSKWASDLQSSLQRERERFEKLAKSERAVWLVEKMGEEARDGRLVAKAAEPSAGAMVKSANCDEKESSSSNWSSRRKYSSQDPLGLLRWSDNVRTRGWIALQVVGSFGMIGGLAFWFARTCGLTTAVGEWVQGWNWNWNVLCSDWGWGCGEPVFVAGCE